MKRLIAELKTENQETFANAYNELKSKSKQVEEALEDFNYELKHRYEQMDEWLQVSIQGKRTENPEDEAGFYKDQVVDYVDNLKSTILQLESQYNDFFVTYAELLRDTDEYNDEHNIHREEVELTPEEIEENKREVERLMQRLNM